MYSATKPHRLRRFILLTCANCFEKREERFITIIGVTPWCNDRDGCIVAAESLSILSDPDEAVHV